ncbi:hypothetical protein GLE_5277 [Lysobacter enzymogenes]|uniref:DUF4234 domain-containing protein n=1 Tax=Lysobacter enzymogenes TaxID=69 RepID=A0A0S2DQ31_LYSEN|nr:hypothetical protein [Lysobacter enzymogenes]ALN60618.1 hypothetical protein GLE_5277 [Lysobacter enzymogenes]
MQDNVYAPPASDVVVPAPSGQGNEFYVVAPLKFCLLFFFTLGLYQLYWFYMQWARYRRRHPGETLWPVARAIFSIFFAHVLAGRIDAAVRARGERHDWAPGTVATIYVVSQIASSALDRLSSREIGSPLTDVASLVLLAPVGLSLLRLQRAANLACGDPDGDGNRRLSALNYVWLVLGALLWLSLLAGLFALYVLRV